MIRTVIQALDAAIATHIPTVVRHGIAELHPADGGTAPVAYASDGSFQQITSDSSGTFSYWRLNGQQKDQETEVVGQCDSGFEVTVPLRFVAMVDRSTCPVVSDAAFSASWAARDAVDAIRVTINAISISLSQTSIDTDTRRVYQQEYGRPLDNADKAFLAIDVSVVVVGNAECFDPCGDTGDFLCRMIQSRQWATIQACLTQAQEDAAIAALCEGGPCPTDCEVIEGMDASEIVACVPSGDRTELLCEVMDTAEATPEAIVVCLDGANKTDAVRDIICTPCPKCDPLTITINGVEYKEIEDPCGGIGAVRVRDADDNDVGSLDGTTWRIPSVTVQLKDSANNNIGSADIYLPGANTTKTAPDATVQLKDSAGVNIGSADSYRSNTSNNKTAPDGTVTINNSVPTTLHTVAVKSNGSATQAIADSTITKPDGTTVGLPATVALDVRNYRSGIAYQFGKKDWSGQTTEYRTGDEKDIFDAGFFDYTRPVYPTHYAELGSNFTTLAANNSFGNTNRFTDEAGNAVATSGNRYILDHLTGLMWYRPSSLPTAATWNDAIDACEAASTGGYTDWHMPPINLLMQLVQYEASVNLNYGGFLITVSLWSGTTNPYNTTQARSSGATSSVTEVNAFKTGTLSYLYCRRFV